MTSRTKRRLAVLALALGLIAAAPYGFRAVVDGHFHFRLGVTPWLVEAAGYGNEHGRTAEFWLGPFRAAFASPPHESRFVCTTYPALPLSGDFTLPRESLTLRVACAAALADV